MILFLHSSAGRYGADRQLLLLVERLERPARVWLPMDGPLVADLRAAGAEVEIRPLPVLRRELLNPRGLLRLARDMRQTGGQRGLSPQSALVHANTSVILTRADVVHVREIYPRWAWPLLRLLTRRAKAIVCVSQAVAEQFGSRATVVHDGLPFAPERRDRAAARAELGLGEEFAAAVVGRVSGWKGQPLLAEALPAGAIGLIAGDAWPGQEHHLDALRGDPRLRLLGFRDDVETVYGAADVVVVPSTRPDPFPNAALEAAAAGCCVVAAAHGGLPEMIRDGETGRLFAPNDAAALRAVLEELRRDPAQIARLGAAARTDVRERFTPERMAAGIEAVYRTVEGR